MNSTRWEQLWINAKLATMVSDASAPYGLIENAALATQGGRIAWLGSQADLPGDPMVLAENVTDCNGQLVTPGLIDCHTHLVYGGDRCDEFEMRLNGASYEEIALAGGGIVSTVNATRNSSEADLFDSSKVRLERLMKEGVTTIEIKSGYGLNLEQEAKQLRVARRLDEEFRIRVKTTFLGAHALPPEFEGNADGYIDEVCSRMMPEISKLGLADAVDAFCENIAFSTSQVTRVFNKAKELGLSVKLHAEQLSNMGGAKLASQFDALSVDHLEYLDTDGVEAIKQSGTVAVLLPGAFYCLRETKLPPIDLLRSAAVPIAIATDSNPGSSPVLSLLLMLNMGCALFNLTPEETLAGVTRNAAKALGIDDEVGTLEVGKRADIVLWRVNNPAQLSHIVGGVTCEKVLYCGEVRDG